MPKLFALLISIDKYAKPTHNLSGCNNDRIEMNRFLERYAKAQELEYIPIMLSDEAATRQGVIDSFKHFDASKAGDICVFYFSGHGSQSVAPAEILTNPNGMNESLVCHDSRIKGGRDLMDKELGYLIWKANQGKKIHFTSIVDSCHSGSATRSLDHEQSRNIPPNYTPVTAKDYLGVEEYQKVEGKLKPKETAHFHLGACRDAERAKERNLNGQPCGVFTYSFLETMKDGGVFQSYEEIMQRIRIKVQQLSVQQHPQLETPGNTDAHSNFLGLKSDKKGLPFLVYFDQEKGDWMLDAGGLQGLELFEKRELPETKEELSEEQKNELELELETEAKENNSFADSKGIKVFLQEVLMNKSRILGTNNLDKEKTYPVWRVGKEAKAIRIAFDKTVSKKQQKSLEKEFETYSNIHIISKKEEAKYTVKIFENAFILTRTGEDVPVFKRVETAAATAFSDFAKYVENVAEWEKILDVFNPKSEIPREDIEIVVKVYDDPKRFKNNAPHKNYTNPNEPIVLEEFSKSKRGNYWLGQVWEVEVFNNSETQQYFLSGVKLDADFAINHLSSYGQNIPLPPGKSARLSYNFKGNIYYQSAGQIKGEYFTWGVHEIRDFLKIFISTSEMEREFRKQAPLPLDIGHLVFDPTRFPPEDVILNDWIVFNIEFKLKHTPPKYQFRPKEEFEVGNLKLTAPDNFQGAIGLAKLENLHSKEEEIPPFFWKDKTEVGEKAIEKTVMPISNAFNQTDGMEVLEIEGAQGIEAIDAGNPLIINLEDLGEDEAVIPWGYDPETGQYFPVGNVTPDGKIEINNLPEEQMREGDRSLGGSIKIFFQKIIKKDKTKYPLLRQCEVSPEQDLTYLDKPLNEIGLDIYADKKPKKIALFIHGIIGDTLDMVKLVERVNLPNGKKLNSYYDFVLAFDYENLGTVVTETAEQLKTRLEKMGITADHPHEVHIYAHSMGGLVSRYFIEEFGGDKIVSRLFQFGTPNGGSEWADVRDLVAVLLPIVVGKIAWLQPYLSPLAFAGKYLDKATKTLSDMNNTSDIIKNLNKGNAAKVPYTLINGNTQSARDLPPANAGFLKKIIHGFKNKPHYALLDAALFQAPNDIAVTVESQKTLRVGADFTRKEIGCDHLSYFSDPVSLKAFEEVLEELKF